MSVNSGFSTRLQQKKYNQYLQAILSVLAKRLIKFYTLEDCDQSRFIYIINNLYQKMLIMQESKFMEPHYSYIVKEVIVNLTDNMYKEQRSNFTKQQQFLDRENIKSNLFVHKGTTEVEYNRNKLEELSIFDNQYKKSQNNLNLTTNNFKKRVRTVVPQTFVNPRYFTPQKIINKEEQLGKLIKDKDSLFKKQMIANSKITKQKQKGHINKPSNKLNKIQRQKSNLSPTQFLKQAVNHSSRKQKMNSSHLVLRTKQKHQKIIEG